MAFPGTYNFNYYKGDTYSFIIRPKNADGTAMDLTPFMYNSSTNPNNVKFIIANQRGGGSGLVEYAADADVDDVDNIVTCTISDQNCGDDLTALNTWVYDVQITNGSTLTYTLLTGTITVTNDVSGAGVL